MNPFFQNNNIFLARKIHFFLRKKIEKVFENFRFFLRGPINSEKFPMNSISKLRNLSKRSKMDYIEDYWKWDENSLNFWIKSTDFVEK